MSELVLGIGASHSTLMNTHGEETADLPAATRFRQGLEQVREELREARPDAVVVIGSNHFRGMFLDLMPAFTVGVSEVNGAGEAGTPGGPLPVDLPLARHLVEHVTDTGFDLAFSLRLTVDHGITHSLQYLLPELEIPIVPIVINMFAPPLPSLQRCHDLGTAIGEAIAADGESKRVAIIASGGLSHRLPWPKWYETLTEDDRFLVEAWLNGRTSWGDYEVRRRQIVRAATPDINEDFDRWFLDLMETGDLSALLSRSDEEIEQEAGNGAHELRAWVAMSAAMKTAGDPQARTIAYGAVDSWLTGMGVSLISNHATKQ